MSGLTMQGVIQAVIPPDERVLADETDAAVEKVAVICECDWLEKYDALALASKSVYEVQFKEMIKLVDC